MFPAREMLLGLASNDVEDFLVWLELCTVDFQGSNSLDRPSQTEINLFQPPVFEECGAPETGDNSVRKRISWEIEPCEDTGDRGES